MNIRFVAALLVSLGAASIALAAAPSTPSEKSLDVRNPRLEVQWASDARPAPFTQVLLAPVELQFREVPSLAGPPGMPGTRSEFPVNERDREALARDANRILREELAKSTHFTLVDQAAAGVLVLQPALRDIVSKVPPEEPPGRSTVLLDSAGEATLVVTLVDGASGQVLGSASDRRDAEGSSGYDDFGAIRSNSVAVGQEVRRVLRRWGMSLERRVEQLYFAARPR
ncbi:MAG: DUF3313 family protein [Gammaproteobacteria bacterium PRO8]|nr:DUF3313 family protein [Gammaproteobacteria bacterium PRO8]